MIDSCLRTKTLQLCCQDVTPTFAFNWECRRDLPDRRRSLRPLGMSRRLLQLERLVRSLCDGCAAESGGRGQNKANKGGDDGDGGRTGEKGEAKGAGPVDLNRVSEAELEAAKASMDVGFEATRIRPGDERWQYDVQVDFAPGDGPNDWDDSESD